MIEPPIVNPVLHEIDTWRDLVQSDNWKVFKKLMAGHKDFLEKQVVIAVHSKDMDSAVRYEARADECGKILQLVEDRLAEIQKNTKEEED